MGGTASTTVQTQDLTKEPLLPSQVCAPGVLQTGDIVLFNGSGWRSALIRWFTWSNYTHVGMVHWRRIPGHGDAPVLCLWESTGHADKLPCLLHQRHKSGVRLVPLEHKLLEYVKADPWGDTRISVVPLQFRSDADRQTFERLLTEFEDRVADTPYAGSASRLLAAGYPMELGTQHLAADIDSYTCNQLVAVTLIRARAFTSSLPDGQITVSGFAEGALDARWSDLATTQGKNFVFRIVDPQQQQSTTTAPVMEL